MDPGFIDELILVETAASDHQLFSADSKDEGIRMRQTQRRAHIARWRRGTS